MKDNNYKGTLIALLRFKRIVSRKLIKQKGRWKLVGYDFPNVGETNLGLIYNLLMDKYAPQDSLPQNSKEQEVFQKALNSNKFKWFELILNCELSSEVVPEISLTNFYHANKTIATTVQLLIISLDEPSPYETGITLDFPTGFLIVPRTALKGITGQAAVMELGGKTNILPYGENLSKTCHRI